MFQKNKIHELIIDKIKSHPDIILGIADISYSDYSDHYKCALVLVVPHEEYISINNYSEEKFEEIICAAREQINIIISDLSDLFQENNIEYYIPPAAQTDEISLTAPFSFKFAAVNAGIGWIGKNGALKGVQWDINKFREELIDYQLCNLKRSLFFKKHNRKNACGLCMAACP